MVIPEAQVKVNGQAGKQAEAWSYCISSADVGGPEISGAERLKTQEKLHKKAMETARRHREELGIPTSAGCCESAT